MPDYGTVSCINCGKTAKRTAPNGPPSAPWFMRSWTSSRGQGKFYFCSDRCAQEDAKKRT